MSPSEALQVLSNATEALSTTRANHKLLLDAISTLSDFLKSQQKADLKEVMR